MRSRFRSATSFTVSLVAVLLAATLVAARKPVTHSATLKTRTEGAFAKLPIHFEANRGQADERVKFIARARGYDLFFTPAEAVMSFAGGAQASRSALRIQLPPSGAKVEVIGLEEQPGKVNYLLRENAEPGWTNIPTYARIKYRNAFPGVDLVFYGNQQDLECDFVVAPGADPNAITLSFDGIEALAIDADGDLILSLPSEQGSVRLRRPSIYQEVNGRRRQVSGSYVLRSENRVAFQIASYDRARALVIDPVLSFSTYLGGASADLAQVIAVDTNGNIYVAGGTTSANFPTAQPIVGFNNRICHPYDSPYATPCSEAFVTKLDPTGSTLIYSTFLGIGTNTVAWGLAVDASGNAYVTGSTDCCYFPSHVGYVFVAKLDPSGSRFVYSIGLNGGNDEFGLAITADSAGNAYVTGRTRSSNFPTKDAIQPACHSLNPAVGGNAFVTKLDPSGGIVWSTCLGGSTDDMGTGIAVDSAGAVYVTGSANSSDFPTTPGAFQTTSRGYGQAFVTKINPQGSALVYSTYLGGSGGSGGDKANAIAVDASGNAYIAGSTASPNFPTVNPIQPAPGSTGDCYGIPCSDAFITKLNATGSALVFSTYLGGNQSDWANGVALDAQGNVYVIGDTNSPNFPTVNAIQTASDVSNTGHAFIAKLNPSGSGFVYSTYLGGNGGESGRSIAVDSSGNACVTGYTTSQNFPTVRAFQPNNAGSPDTFIAKISEDVSTPPPPPTIQTSSVPDGTLNTLYRTTVAAREGALPYVWSISSGSLPTGLTLESGTGVISGRPTVTGTSEFTLEVTDANSRKDRKPLTMTVNRLATVATDPAVTEYPVPAAENSPYGIAVGSDGALWFTEIYGNKIGRITTAGVISEYSLPARFANPFFITAGPDGALWFAEGAGKIGRITTAGVITEYPIPTPNSGPIGITSGPDGALWFTENDADRIGRITTDGVVTEYPIPKSGSPYVQPLGITTGPDGALWFTESFTNKIGRITTAGVITEYLIPTAYSRPFGITAGADGALWFTETAYNKVGRITTSGVITEYPIPTAGMQPFGITTGPDGAVWVAEFNGDKLSKIGRITTDGVITEYPIPTAYSYPRHIVTGPDGALWFTEQSQIGRLDPSDPANSPSITSSSLPNGIQNMPYSATLAASGGAAPYTWSIAFGALPDGVVLAPSTGVISGMPKAMGTRSFAVMVTDAKSRTSTKPLSIKIDFMQVTIDIKPGDSANVVPQNSGTIPIAVLSTRDFDAPTHVNRSSLTFGRSGDEQSLAFCNPAGADMNRDGRPDLLCHFRTDLAGFRSGDTVGILKAVTNGGVPVRGTDSVRVVR